MEFRMRTLLLLLMSAIGIGMAFAEDSELPSFQYGLFTCEVWPDSEDNKVSITYYDGRGLTVPLIFPDSVENEGKKYVVEAIYTDMLMSGQFVPERIVIPNSVKIIGPHAFDGSEGSLRSTDIEFGENVQWIGERACYGYSNDIHIKAKYPPFVEGGDAFLEIYSGNNTYYYYPNIFVPRESLGKYRTADVWCEYKDYLYAIGSFNLIESNYFKFSDGVNINSEVQTYLKIVNDTGLEIKSVSCASSDTNLLYVKAKKEKDSIKVDMQTFDSPGNVVVTVSAEMEDGSFNNQQYSLLIYNKTDAVDEIGVDDDKHMTVYSLDGRKVGVSTDALEKGLYIVKEGKETHKIIVR